MLSSLAVAVPESSQVGPYTVSFDLNTNLNYQIQTPEKVEIASAVAYPIWIITDNVTGASITITEYKELRDSSLQLNEENTALRMFIRGINATAPIEQTIDGMKGFVISGMPGVSNMPQTTFLQALYWLDSKDCECGPVSVGTTSVGIFSTYPEDVTTNLLNSLHVVKGQAAAPDMPPATN